MGRPIPALLAAALAPGCHGPESDPPDAESAYVDLYLDDGILVCGGQLASYDRFIDEVFLSWTGHDPGDFRVSVHAVAESDCPMGLSCATGGNAWISRDRAQYHELVHVLQWDVDGRSVISLEEGTAEAFGPITPLAQPSSSLADLTPDFLYADHLTGTDYGVAAVFTRFLVERFGIDSYRSFFRTLHLVDDPTPSDFDDAFEAVLQQPLIDVWPEFVSQPRCAYDFWYCGAAKVVTVPFDVRDFQCDDDDVFGFDASALDLLENQFNMSKIVVLQNEMARAIEVEVEFVDVDIGVCGDCSQQQPVLSLSSFDDGPGAPLAVPVDLDEGNYVFIIRARPGGDARVSVVELP